jgi:hypothetical protein
VASYKCLICDEAKFPDHDCLHIDSTDFALKMELLSLSFVSTVEPEEYIAPIVPRRILTGAGYRTASVPLFLRM